MSDSIDVLKATIISIFFSHMGMEKELIRKIMTFDNELKWQTMCLLSEGDRPFKHPNEIIEEQQKVEEEQKIKAEQMVVEKEKKTVFEHIKDGIFHLIKKK